MALACRCNEITNMTIDNVVDKDILTIVDTKSTIGYIYKPQISPEQPGFDNG